jgi:hypothetical protein
MLRSFTHAIRDLKGSPIKEDDKVVTLETIAVGALMMALPNDTTPGPEKVQRFKLAQRIDGSDTAIDVTAEEITMLKDLIGKLYTPLVVGRAYELLEKE